MIKKIVLSLVLASAYLVTPQNTFAESEFKVAVIDVNKLINGLPESKAKKVTFEKEQKAIKQSLQSKQSKVAALEKKFKESGADPKSKEAEELRKAILDYQKTANQEGQKLQADFLKANKELSDKVLKVVKEYAKEKHYTLVLDKNLSATSPVLYGDESVDITNIIANMLK